MRSEGESSVCIAVGAGVLDGPHGERCICAERRGVGDAGPYARAPYPSVGRDAHFAPPYNDPVFPVDAHERQRRKMKINSSYKTITTMFRERAVKGYKFAVFAACADS